MEIFQNKKKYKLLTLTQNKKVKVYTARILEEGDMFVKFIDKKGKEITLKKEKIIEVKKL